MQPRTVKAVRPRGAMLTGLLSALVLLTSTRALPEDDPQPSAGHQPTYAQPAPTTLPAGLTPDDWTEITAEIARDRAGSPPSPLGATFPEEAKLAGSEGFRNDSFGASVALDGDILVVGAPGEDGGNTATGTGAAYVFERNLGGIDRWTQRVKLTGSTAAAGADFGFSVAIDGDRIVVGAPELSGGGAGAVYLFERSSPQPDHWGETHVFTASDGAAGDEFGYSVDVNGDRVVVGAQDAQHSGLSSPGKAYVYSYDSGTGTWSELELVAPDAGAFDAFGHAVAIDGDTIVVGAPGDDHSGLGDVGSAYVFEHAAGNLTAFVTSTTHLGDFGSGYPGGSLAYADAACNARAAAGSLPGAYLAWISLAGGADPDDRFVHTSSAWVLVDGTTTVADDYQDLTDGTLDAAIDQDESGAPPSTLYVWTGTAASGLSLGSSITTCGSWTDDSTLGAVGFDSLATSSWSSATSLQCTDSAHLYCFQQEWGNTAKLVASDPWQSAGDSFGIAVDLSGDEIVVGAHFVDAGGNSNAGSAYFFNRSAGSGWGQIDVAPGATAGALHGAAVAVDASTAIVGSPGADVGADIDVGLARIYEKSGTWSLTTTVFGSEENGDAGEAVAISGDIAAVAQEGDRSNTHSGGANAGAVHVHGRDVGGTDSWGLVEEVLPAGQPFDDFGFSLSADGDLLAVGAPLADDACYDAHGVLCNSGAVFLFRRDPSTGRWSQAHKVTANDPEMADWFGYAVSLQGGTLAVGAPLEDDGGGDAGALYIFEQSSNWGQTKKIVPSGGDHAAGDRFGHALSLYGDHLIVGAPRHDHGGLANSGGAWAFARDQGGADNWGEVSEIVSCDLDAGDEFGHAVAQGGSLALIGAPFDDPPSTTNLGLACIYLRDAATGIWNLEKTLACAQCTGGANFGWSIAFDAAAARVAVGALGDDTAGAVPTGAVYLFERNRGGAFQWGLAQKLFADDLASGDFFGSSVALDGGTLLVGAPRDDDDGGDSGSAYVFERDFSPPDARLQFVTSTLYDGDLGGVAGADAKCQAVATAAGLPGTYKAWLSDGAGSSPALDFDTTGGPFQRTDGTLLATDWADLTDGTLFAAPNIEEDGVTVSPTTDVWTGTDEAGQPAGTNCNGWTVNFGNSGGTGDTTSATAWSANVSRSCAMTLPLYCFQTHQEDAWSQRDKVLPSGNSAADRSGTSVAVAGEILAVGAPDEDVACPPGTPDCNTGAVYTLERACELALPLTQNAWHLLSLPCDPAGITVGEALGDDFTGGLFSTWGILYWDASLEDYVQMALTDTLEQGRGYWLKTTEAGRTAHFERPSFAATSGGVAVEPLVGAGGGRWNLVGHPFIDTVLLEDYKVDSSGTVYDWTTAASMGLVDSAAHRWESGYACIDPTDALCEEEVGEATGLWVYAYTGADELQVPTGATGMAPESSTAPTPAAPLYGPGHRHDLAGSPAASPEEWWVRVTVTADGMRDTTSGFGQLVDAFDGYDSHDTREPESTFAPYLTVVFPHPEWGAHAGLYTTDYHRLRGHGRADAWLFEVRSDVVRSAVLGFSGPARILERLVLVDLESGEEVPITGGSYAFTMSDPEHRFEIRLRRGRH